MMEALKNQILFLTAFLLMSGVFTSEASAKDYKAGMNRVEFTSEGEKMVGNLFLPPNYKAGDKLAAIVVEGPWTTVKEQVAGNYAKKLAEQGFAALAFDNRFWGESGGEPRQYESPRAKIQDIKNAVAFVQTLPMVDKERVGSLGVCFGAGYVIAAATEDNQIKSFATVAAWIHNAKYLEKTFGADGVKWRRETGDAARAKFERTKQVEFVPAASTTNDRAAMFKVDYYSDKSRGVIPQWKNQFATISWTEWLDFDAVALAPKVSTPGLIVHSDGSALPDAVRDFYNSKPGAKDLFWTQGNHTDFYDREAYVSKAAEAIAEHFKRTLNNQAQKVSNIAGKNND